MKLLLLAALSESISAGNITTGGEVIYEAGTARMGQDRRTSVLNGFNQTHDVKNLFVADGAACTSNPDKNQTLTIIA